jgi:hypothetical protein
MARQHVVPLFLELGRSPGMIQPFSAILVIYHLLQKIMEDVTENWLSREPNSLSRGPVTSPAKRANH